MPQRRAERRRREARRRDTPEVFPLDHLPGPSDDDDDDDDDVDDDSIKPSNDVAPYWQTSPPKLPHS